MPNQKKHHFVNAGYLRLFSIPDKNDKYSSFVWVYKKDQKIHAPSRKSVRSICHKEAYYSQIREDGSVDLDVLEDALSKIEDRAIKIIRTLNDNTSDLNISSENKGLLAFYIGLMFSRGPSFRDGIKKLHELVLQKMLILYEGKNPIPFDYSGSIADVVNIWVSEQISLDPMIKFSSWVAEVILRKYWQFQRPCSNVNFITSDTPVIIANSLQAAGPCHPLTEFIFPLRKDLCLVCTYTNPSVDSNNLVFDVDSDRVLKLNEAIAQAACSEIYASESSEKVATLAVKYYGVSQKLQVN